MDLVLNGRGIEITDHVRKTVEHKLAKISRRPRPEVTRLEVEIVQEHNPRIQGSHRVQVACEAARVTFRAEGSGPDVDSALDEVVERIERQMETWRSKREDAKSGRRARVQSGMAEETETSE